MAPESAEAPATRGEEAPEGSRGPEPELFIFGSTGPAAPVSPSRSPRKRSGGNRPWADFEAQAAEAAAARAEEWELRTQWGAPVRCVFLGPESAAGATVAAGDRASPAHPDVGFREEVRFRWSICVPDAPPGFPEEEIVTVRADNVLHRGIPIPAAWDPVLQVRARVLRAVEEAGRDSAGYECSVQGLYRAPAVAPASQPPAPRAGEKWVVQESSGMRTEVWVAGHHAADEWWCVKAQAGLVSG